MRETFLDDTSSKHHHHGRDDDDADDFETATKMVLVGGRGAGFGGGPRGRLRGAQNIVALFCVVVWGVEQQKREG